MNIIQWPVDVKQESGIKTKETPPVDETRAALEAMLEKEGRKRGDYAK